MVASEGATKFSLAALKLLWANRDTLKPLLPRLQKWWSGLGRNKRGILIIGPGGVGKTTLATFLAGDTTLHSQDAAEYVESIGIEHRTLKDAPHIQITVPPGQEHRVDPTWTTVLEELRSGHYRGVMLVFSDGFHSLGDISYEQHKLFDPEHSVEEFVSKYVEVQRAEEIKVFKKICDSAQHCTSPLWIHTVVTKKDLWADDRDAVEQRYRSGKFAKVVDKCLGSKAADQCRHELSFVSLVSRNFVTGRNELLKPTVSGFDQTMQLDSIEQFLRTFEGLMKWEDRNG